ncbi:MAG TPA: hypothetical protein VLV16_11100 [Gemmatimonadales bacterium]|nr:hypothetical protein [Gemmatimonadales bacterium]
MIRYRTLSLLSLVSTLALAACEKQPDRSAAAATGTTDTLTERQRHEMLSTSGIPGASGVGAAMRAADATSGGIHAAESTEP